MKAPHPAARPDTPIHLQIADRWMVIRPRVELGLKIGTVVAVLALFIYLMHLTIPA